MSEQPITIQGVDFERLASWMDSEGLPMGRIGAIRKLAGGTQNIILRFERGGAAYVLRRPPLVKRSNSDKTLEREAKMLAALADTHVPHPNLLGVCYDQDVIGANFILMAEIDGFNASTGLPESHISNADLRFEMGLSMVDAIAALGNVDYLAAGLHDFGRPEGFLQRQVPRWLKQLQSYSELHGYAGPRISGLDELSNWLLAQCPKDFKPGIMHGDYHLGNVLFDYDSGQIKAVLDWELSTIGDPLLDFGALLAGWGDRELGLGPTLPIEPWEGFPSRQDLLARYAQQSDRNLEHLDWYEVLACFRLGVLLEGTHARACAGQVKPEIGERLRLGALEMFKRAHIRMNS